MAVFTPVSDGEAAGFLDGYDLGGLVALTPIAEGVENTNYRLETDRGLFVLTLFEGRTEASALPFCLGLTDHLAAAGLPAARPMADEDGGWIGRLNARPAAIVEWRSGVWLRDPDTLALKQAGALLARMHLAAADYPGRRDNPVGPLAWRDLANRIAEGASGAAARLLDRVEAEWAALGDPFNEDLPRGAIHADYFPDNLLFDHGAPSGVIDFYFACTAPWTYDLAIALSAWGFHADGRARPDALRAFQQGYESVRRLTPLERSALPRLGRAAALRFTLTRLHDQVFHDPAKLVMPKDPSVFMRRLDHWHAFDRS